MKPFFICCVLVVYDEDGYAVVYTDGCCLNNGQHGAKAGIGVWWNDDHPL